VKLPVCLFVAALVGSCIARAQAPTSTPASAPLAIPVQAPKTAAATPLQKQLTDQRSAATPAAGVLARGDVVACLTNPRFLTQLRGFSSRAYFSTSDRFAKGLILEDRSQMTGPTSRPLVYQHPSWSSFGWLAGIHFDHLGNVFSVPAPKINVLDNPPHEQNRVMKVDTVSGEMKLLTQLPKPPVKDVVAAYKQNPYGAIGIAFDCDTGLIYVSSIAGSTRAQEVGRIFVIEAKSGDVKYTLEKTDAMGLHLFKNGKEKRLYFGKMREPEIWSIAVDSEGKLVGDARFEISIEGMGPRGDDRVRKIGLTR
jgi:hypothetical protein